AAGVDVVSCITAIVCYGISIAIILTSSVLKPLFTSQYNFQVAIQNFGLITTLGLDIKNLIFGSSNNKFEQVETEDVADTSVPEVEILYNKLDLDLSEETGKIGEINSYISSLSATKQNDYTGLFKGKNLIFITAEAFTAELIDPELTPTLYRLANRGIQFTDYYQPASAGTTGGEYQNIFGMLPTSGGMSFKKTANHYNYMTIGSQLDRLGYYGKAYHNNSYTYYSRNLTHVNLGYSDGFMGYGNGMEQYVENQWPQSDFEMFSGTLTEYIDKQPFSIYYMSVSGHSGYSIDENAMSKKHWDRAQHLPYSDYVKGYFAANLELEDALTHLVSELENKGIADDTVICISTDHFPYGLDKEGSLGNMPLLSELYGYNVENLFQRDHSRLILWCGSLENEEPIIVDTPTFSLDILPTLSNLFGTEFDSRLFVGRDVFSDAEPLVFNSQYDWKTNLGTYYASRNQFVPAEGVESVPENYVENMKTTVRNKVNYCTLASDNDYFRYLFEKQ
ncbi:MAG: LTA synthase family protein, partial [Clostridia bacterium]|nr:LTA synthase family protein [Clostridia bacterium]